MSESGTQLFARLEARRCLKDVEPRLFAGDGGPDRGEVVEVYGPEGTGEVSLGPRVPCPDPLEPFCSGVSRKDGAALPPAVSLRPARDSWRSGGGRRLCGHTLQSGHVPAGQCSGQSTERDSAGSDDAVLRSCLSRLLVVRCSCSSQLLLTLHFLETTLSSRPRAALLLIDSISAFYWSDRSEGGASVAKQEEKLSRCSELLGRLLRDFRITIFATCHPIRRGSNGPQSSSEADRSHLCRAWQRLVTHRLVCSRQEAEHNPANGDEGSGEQRNWQVFTVHCSSWTGTKASRVSSFRVTDGGVEFIWTPRPPPAL
ncbi:DNA repair protein XRCC2 isoform X1 [Poecilia reticulata]|uniref:DNA repair protein XRCC2 isoform X1 n=1 Tax=Poecilia reticulata TaxID=8081 RepID=UPI0007EB130A|nr:PREDICTED: DNA repair protein XRCC2 isoform X1 [Poecilia reticulata]